MNYILKLVFVALLLLANQAFPQYSLNITPNGDGTGTVSRDPNKSTYFINEQVTLTAIPDSECDEFSHWSSIFGPNDGGCTGKTNTCTLLMDDHKQVTANFNRKTFQLNTNADHGKVDKYPPRLTNNYNCGTTVTLTAKPEICYQFVRWEGVTNYEDTSAAVQMNQEKTVTAVFEKSSLTVTPNVKNIVEGTPVEINFQVDGGKAPYTWTFRDEEQQSWTPSATVTAPETRGEYPITVQDSCNNTGQATVKVYGLPVLSPQKPEMKEQKQLDLTLQGGKSPYYLVNVTAGQVGPITDEDGDGIFNLTYTAPSVDKEVQGTLTVRDALGQEQSTVINIKPTDDDYGQLLLLSQNSNVKEQRQLDLTVQGGKPPYDLVKVTAGQVGLITDEDGDDIFSLTYTAPSVDEKIIGTLTVRDALGQEQSVDITIVPVIPLTVTPETVTLSFGEERTLKVINGKPPYKWTANKGDQQLSTTTGEQVTYVANLAGEDIVTLTDGQEETAIVKVTVVTSLGISPESATQVSVNDKAIIFEAIGGFEPYQWVASEEQKLEAKGAKALYTPPAKEGEYHLTVSDGKGHKAKALVQVFSVPVITPKHTVLSTKQEKVFKVTGGHGEYHWNAKSGEFPKNEGNEVNYIAPNMPGLDTVTVVDRQGSKSNAIVQVVTGGGLICHPPQSVAAVGETVHFAVAHGIAPYTWSDGTKGRIFETRFDQVGLQPVEVRDAKRNACVAMVNVIDGTLEITPATAYLQPNEMTNFSVTGGISPYTWVADVGSLLMPEDQQVNYVAPDEPGRYHLTVKDGRTVQGSAEVIVTAELSKLSGEQPDTEGGQIHSGIKIDEVARPEQRSIQIDQDAKVEIKFPLKVPNDEPYYNTYCAVLWNYSNGQLWFKTNDQNNPFVLDWAPGKPFPVYSQAKSGESVVIDIYSGYLSEELLGQFNFYIGYAPAGENELDTLILTQEPYTLEIK